MLALPRGSHCDSGLLAGADTHAQRQGMPVRPSDLRPSAEQLDRIRRLLADWDARDIWRPSANLDAQVIGLVAQLCAPKIVFMATPVHAAKFLREIVASHRLVE